MNKVMDKLIDTSNNLKLLIQEVEKVVDEAESNVDFLKNQRLPELKKAKDEIDNKIKEEQNVSV